MAHELSGDQEPDREHSAGKGRAEKVVEESSDTQFKRLAVSAVVAVGILGALLVVAHRFIGPERQVPLGFVFRILDDVNRPWEVIVAVLVAAALGSVVALGRSGKKGRLRVSEERLTVERGRWSATVPRQDAASIYTDGQFLVVLDSASRQQVYEDLGLPVSEVVKAFEEQGYPWIEKDPFADEYKEWGPDAPELSAPVNSILTARRSALRRKEIGEARSLRSTLNDMGFAVRDVGGRQHWRPIARP